MHIQGQVIRIRIVADQEALTLLITPADPIDLLVLREVLQAEWGPARAQTLQEGTVHQGPAEVIEAIAVVRITETAAVLITEVLQVAEAEAATRPAHQDHAARVVIDLPVLRDPEAPVVTDLLAAVEAVADPGHPEGEDPQDQGEVPPDQGEVDNTTR